jgi:hypothetical protein
MFRAGYGKIILMKSNNRPKVIPYLRYRHILYNQRAGVSRACGKEFP